jgi:hypothetical protein
MTIQRMKTAQEPEASQTYRIGVFLFIVVLVGAFFMMGRSMVQHHFFDGGTQIGQYDRPDSDTR